MQVDLDKSDVASQEAVRAGESIQKPNRRRFLTAAVAVLAGNASLPIGAAAENDTPSAHEEGYGMLVDTTQCIGCRKCEWACAQANKLTDHPLEVYEDTAVFDQPRRMAANAYTVVNRYADPTAPTRPIFCKQQCMHCLKPACASACIVGALKRQDTGAVTYDAWKCMGCRYCMIACPFQVPAYEYENPFTPVVSKCNFCFERVSKEGQPPACAGICPPMCLTYGKRTELLNVARETINMNPGRYVDHIYGEHEVGGTSWLYLTSRPVVELGLLELGNTPPPSLTETIQHSVFRFGIPPLLLFGLLGMVMRTFRPDAAVPENRNAS